MSRAGIARLYCLRGTFLVDALSSFAWFAQVGCTRAAYAVLKVPAQLTRC